MRYLLLALISGALGAIAIGGLLDYTKPQSQRPQPQPHQYVLHVVDIPLPALQPPHVLHRYTRVDLTDGTVCDLDNKGFYWDNGTFVGACR